MRKGPTASEVTSTALPCRYTPGILQLNPVIPLWSTGSSPACRTHSNRSLSRTPVLNKVGNSLPTSEWKQLAFNSWEKNLASQSDHHWMCFHTTDASPPQLVLSFNSVSRKRKNNMGKENSPWPIHSLFYTKRRPNWVTGWSTHLISFQDSVTPNETKPEPASSMGAL